MTQAERPPRPASADEGPVQPLRLTDAPDPAFRLQPLLTAMDVARILSVRPKRVYELGIPAVRISEKSLRWRLSDLETWLEQRKGIT